MLKFFWRCIQNVPYLASELFNLLIHSSFIHLLSIFFLFFLFFLYYCTNIPFFSSLLSQYMLNKQHFRPSTCLLHQYFWKKSSHFYYFLQSIPLLKIAIPCPPWQRVYLLTKVLNLGLRKIPWNEYIKKWQPE